MFKYLLCIGLLITQYSYAASLTLADLESGKSRIVVLNRIDISSSFLKPTHLDLGTFPRSKGEFSVQTSTGAKKLYYDVKYHLDRHPEGLTITSEDLLSTHGCWIYFTNISLYGRDDWGHPYRYIKSDSFVNKGSIFILNEIEYNQATGQLHLEGRTLENTTDQKAVSDISIGCGHPFRLNKETQEEMLKTSLEYIENNLAGLIKFELIK